MENTSIFFRMYYSGEDDMIQLYKALKKCLMNLKIVIKSRKKKDEGYLIILDSFMENLMAIIYQQGDYNKALNVME